MSKLLATLLTASALTLGLAGGVDAQEQRYKYPRMIEILTSNQVSELNTGDRTRSEAIASYLIGFTLWVDRSCDFLPMETFKRLETTATNLSSNGQRGDDRHRRLFEVLRHGVSDAKQFIAENGCATRASRAAIASLGQVFRS